MDGLFGGVGTWYGAGNNPWIAFLADWKSKSNYSGSFGKTVQKAAEAYRGEEGQKFKENFNPLQYEKPATKKQRNNLIARKKGDTLSNHPKQDRRIKNPEKVEKMRKIRNLYSDKYKKMTVRELKNLVKNLKPKIKITKKNSNGKSISLNKSELVHILDIHDSGLPYSSKNVIESVKEYMNPTNIQDAIKQYMKDEYEEPKNKKSIAELDNEINELNNLLENKSPSNEEVYEQIKAMQQEHENIKSQKKAIREKKTLKLAEKYNINIYTVNKKGKQVRKSLKQLKEEINLHGLEQLMRS